MSLNLFIVINMLNFMLIPVFDQIATKAYKKGDEGTALACIMGMIVIPPLIFAGTLGLLMGVV